MLALCDTARVFRREGTRNGRPVYAANGEAHACRADAVNALNASGEQLSGGARVRLIMEPADVSPGDRIALGDGRTLVAVEVRPVCGMRGVHHLELLARSEG